MLLGCCQLRSGADIQSPLCYVRNAHARFEMHSSQIWYEIPRRTTIHVEREEVKFGPPSKKGGPSLLSIDCFSLEVINFYLLPSCSRTRTSTFRDIEPTLPCDCELSATSFYSPSSSGTAFCLICLICISTRMGWSGGLTCTRKFCLR